MLEGSRRARLAGATFAALLLGAPAVRAASLEESYLAARDRQIAALAKIRDVKVADARMEQVRKDLERRLRAIVGPLAVAGFPAEGKLNLDSLLDGDEGFGMLDGLIFGEHETDDNVVVSTDGLLDRWLRTRHADDAALPVAATEAIRTELFYTWAVSNGTAVVRYGEIPVAVPAGGRFAAAALGARTQDASPDSPDELFVALEHGGRVYVVEEKLAAPMAPIPACAGVRADYAKRLDAANDKVVAASGRERDRLGDEADRLRDAADPAFRACYAEKVRDAPAFKAAADQAAAVVGAFSR